VNFFLEVFGVYLEEI